MRKTKKHSHFGSFALKSLIEDQIEELFSMDCTTEQLLNVQYLALHVSQSAIVES